MKKYHYLTQLGIPKEEQMDNWTKKLEKGNKKYIKNRKKYGISDLVTWNFDDYYMDFMYIHLKRFRETCNHIINLKFNKFKWQGEEFSVEEALDYITNWMEVIYYGKKSEEYNDYECIKKYMSEKNKILHLMAELLPYLNW